MEVSDNSLQVILKTINW